MPTAPMGDAELQAVIDGMPGCVSVTVGSVTANGLLRQPGDKNEAGDAGGGLIMTEHRVLVRAATFGQLIPEGASVTADGIAYKATRSRLQGNGAWLAIYMALP